MDKQKSRILKKGYINIYSKLTSQETRQVYFKNLYKQTNHHWDESLVFLAQEFKKYLKPNLQVLDIGCGNGNYVIDENRKLIEWAVGVDVDSDLVKKNICLDEIKIADASNLPFKSNSFDIVISLWVLEHLKNPPKAISEIYRVLKPTGIFMFVTPNANFLPLKIIHLTSFSKLNVFLNQLLYGRKEQDIFTTYYKANTLSTIKNLISNKFEVKVLKLNYDPSYTSFDLFSFKLSNFLHHRLSFFKITFTYPHIIGILRKNPSANRRTDFCY